MPGLVGFESTYTSSVVEDVGMGHAVVDLKSWRWASDLSVLQQALRFLRQNIKIRHFWKYLICREQRTENAPGTLTKYTIWVVECRAGTEYD